MAHVHIEGVTIEFPVFSARGRSLRAAALNHLGGFIRRADNAMIVRALQDVSLELSDGDRLGIIGSNGSGKTSLLRLVAGVYPPVTGRIRVAGTVSALTDVTLGMDFESTGWENIIYRCVFLGLTFREARARAAEIAEFSDLGDFLEMPVRTYSNGMLLRLTFSISTAINPDILVMDEMISWGDPAFTRRATARLNDFLNRSRIVMIASHWPQMLTDTCNRMLWLERGSIRALGDVATVQAQYAAAQEAAIALENSEAGGHA